MKFYYSQNLSHFPNLLHAFTTKESGNLAFHVGDDPQIVEKNHELLSCDLGYEKEKLVYMKQIHSDLVYVVTDEDFSTPPTCDALITNKKELPLMVMVADCSPVLLYDAEQKVVAAVHAGRAGAFQNILKNTLEAMRHEFGSKAKDIYATIGASIGVCCYEVGAEIEKEAKALGLEYAMQKREGHLCLDVNAILKKQLEACGVANIEILELCTSCNKEKLFSYRAEKQTGRFAGVIMLG